MTTLAQPQAISRWRDYLALTKPKVVLLLLITALVGMLLAVRGPLPWSVLLLGSLGIAGCAGAAATLNQVLERHLDAQMQRTCQRPLADGRITPAAALCFALLLGLCGVALLWWFTNPLATWLTLASLIGYGLIYTLFLKRATPQNIVIGGLAGATPPLLGWVAVTGEVSTEPILLLLIIFTWTPPHFWALAIHRREDYARAAIPMLPVTHGVRCTKQHILGYSLLLLAVSVSPWIIGVKGALYLGAALLLGALFVRRAVALYRAPGTQGAMGLFRFSIVYLFALFIALLVDHYWRLSG